MSDTDGPWELHQFPPLPPGTPEEVAGEVQAAWQAWKVTRQHEPYRDARPIDAGRSRYQCQADGVCYVDEDVLKQLFCDYEIEPGSFGTPGTVRYVEAGFVDGPSVLPDAFRPGDRG